MGISIWGMSAFFDHARWTYWFCSVFYSTFALSAFVKNMFFLLFLGFVVSPLWWLARGAWVVLLVMFSSCKRKILILYCFLQHFCAVSICWKGVFSHIFKCFCKPLIVISTWRVGHTFGLVLVMQEENLDFVLFFTAFWSRGGLSKRCHFDTFFSFFHEFYVLASMWLVFHAWMLFFSSWRRKSLWPTTLSFS